ncbi:MAG: chromosomal replication initiator protein DnaA [Abditibacteriota bacterium]|nr:chromosomal replication initiator protein DnaA [Abditibacteriota bacterium]
MILENDPQARGIDKATLEQAWARTLELLHQMLPGEYIFYDIQKMTPVLQEDGRIALYPRNGLVYNTLQKNYIKQIREAFCKSLGYDADIVLQEYPKDKKTEEAKSERPVAKKMPFADMNLPLNDEYTFDSFVAGNNNRLAVACAQAVAKEPGIRYNPLFIYGSSGLGKTHLMHAIGHEVYKNTPEARVFFTSGEAFTTLYVNATREGKVAEFKRKIRNIDLFLLDDVQFLVGKEKTVEEFFLFVNTLYESKKQIVFTSDRAPKDLDFDERLTSRFEQGVLTDVRPPDLECRMAILQNKAAREGMSFTLDVIEYVARLITGNVRLLNGALTQLIARASLLRQVVTVDFAKEVLKDYQSSEVKKTVSVGDIIKLVSAEFGVSEAEITGTDRAKEIVTARQAAMYICKETTGLSLSAIGRAFGGRDHSTVYYTLNKMEQRLRDDPDFRTRVNDLLAKIVP